MSATLLAGGLAAASGSAAQREAETSLRIKQLEEQLRLFQDAVVCAFNQIIDLRDINTGCHSTRLAEWAVRIAVELGLDEHYQRSVEVACVLHDLGKIAIPDAILRKERALTPEERERMNRHPEYGWAILRLFPCFELASLFGLHHHERYDGTGYPTGLAGEEIPLGARILSVVDAFDAMVSDRCYRKGMPVEEAIRRLNQGRGTQFDPVVVDRFVAIARRHIHEIALLHEPDPAAPAA
jgi:HD-GYP domain-containing protein (c-di-GMP phosphodiesterase class II)